MPILMEKEEEGVLSPILAHGGVRFMWIKHNNLYRIPLRASSQGPPAWACPRAPESGWCLASPAQGWPRHSEGCHAHAPGGDGPRTQWPV